MAQHLVVSIHDISPRYEREFLQLCECLDRWGVRRRSLCVVPHDEQRDLLCESPSLMARLKQEQAAGNEILLHGYAHRFTGHYTSRRAQLRDRLTTRGCAEFSCMSVAEAGELIERGVMALADAGLSGIRGFVAPGWWQSQEVPVALRSAGFLFFTDTFFITELQPGRRDFAPVVVGLPAMSGFASLLLSLYNFAVLNAVCHGCRVRRVALHPYDLANPRFMARVEHLVRREIRRRTVNTYEGTLI